VKKKEEERKKTVDSRCRSTWRNAARAGQKGAGRRGKEGRAGRRAEGVSPDQGRRFKKEEISFRLTRRKKTEFIAGSAAGKKTPLFRDKGRTSNG